MDALPTHLYRHPSVSWHPVGDAGEEVVILRTAEPMHGEGQGMDRDTSSVQAFVLRGALAVAWWTRVAGDEPADVAALLEEAAEAYPDDRETLSRMFTRFQAPLRAADLLLDRPHDMAMAGDPGLAPGIHPHADGAPDALPVFPLPRRLPRDEFADAWFAPLSLEEFLTQDLVALGTYLGGPSNHSASKPCAYMDGGVGNATAAPSCLPGVDHNLFDALPSGPRCKG